MVLSLAVPLIRPLTAPSKVSVNLMVSPLLLPAVPAIVVRAVEGGVVLLR
jgi:hypothetical protein